MWSCFCGVVWVFLHHCSGSCVPAKYAPHRLRSHHLGNCLCLTQGVLYDGHLRRVLIDKTLYHFRCDSSFNTQALHGSGPDTATINFAQLAKMYTEAEAPTHGMIDLLNIIADPYDPLVGAFQKCVQPGFGGRASVYTDSGIQWSLSLIHQNKAVFMRCGHVQACRKGSTPVM